MTAISRCIQTKPIIAILIIVGIGSPAGRSQDVATIEVNAANKAHYKIPRTIYGTFLEPIGDAIYGGLWAQVLSNPSFEENLWSAEAVRRMVERAPELGRSSRLGLPLPWEPLDAKQGYRYEPRWGDAANSSRSLLLMALPGKQTGVRQQVYLPVHRVLRYKGSFHARHLEGRAEVEVSLRKRNQAEAPLARTAVRLSGRDWARHEYELELPAGKLAALEPADFAIALSDGARALIDQVFLFPADHVDGMDPEIIDLCRALKTPVLRFGGNFTSGYHWRDGVGPVDKRISMLNQAGGAPEYNHFGTDEFLRFCRLIGADPQIALNLGSGTVEEAEAWVRYVNQRWGDRKGGLLWELGNELYGDWQIGYPALEQIGPRTKAFSNAVRRADPRARLIATGELGTHRNWNAPLLALPPGVFDYLSVHFVGGTGTVKRPNASLEFAVRAAYALPVGLERVLRDMKAQIDTHPGNRDRIRIAFTEWLFHSSRGHPGTPHCGNFGGAVMAAGFLNSLMRVADICPVADMTGLIWFGGVGKRHGRAYGVPAYWAFRMYSNTDATVPVETRTTAGSYDVQQGNVNIPEIPNVPNLDVVGALNEAGDRLALFCVNRLSKDIPARIKLAGFSPEPKASAQTLAATAITAMNDETHPQAVVPTAKILNLEAPGVTHTFPHSSVTVIEIRRR